MIRTLCSVMMIGVAGGVGLLGGSVSAHAAPPSTVTVTMPMHIAGFDPVVAAAHGYRVITLSNGNPAVVPAGSALENGASPSPVRPEATIAGPCGTSSISLWSQRSNQYTFQTGFTITRNAYAVEYTWHVSIAGPNSYENRQSYGG